MTDTKAEALASMNEKTVGTYVTYVRPHQLKRTDVFTEMVTTDRGDSAPRRVVIESVTHGEILYRGAYAPVLFVNGVDQRTGRKIHYTKTGWDFMEIERVGDAPLFARVTRSLDQYVY
jgi:hypothetical protein